MQTVTGQQAATNQALDFIAQFLRERGMHIVRTAYDGYSALVATTRPTKTPRVMLVGHIDVVPASQEFFTVRQENGKLYGRGVWDMKSAIAGYMLAVDALKDNLADYDFGIMLSSDEETQDLGIKSLIADGYCPTEAAVLLDGGYDWRIEKVAKGAMCGTVTITDKTGHGSRPWLVRSASMRLVELLSDIQNLFPEPGLLVNTLNISAMQAGIIGKAVNQIPQQASAALDIRVINQAELHRLRACVKALCDKHGAVYDQKATFTPLEHNTKSTHHRAFADHIARVTGTTHEGVVSPGASDAGHFVAKGIDCIVTWPVGGGHHSEQEWIDAQSLEDIPVIITGYLREMAKGTANALVGESTAVH